MVSSAVLVSCCECGGEMIELQPTEVITYKLYFKADGEYRNISRYSYDIPEGTLWMFRNADGAISLQVLEKNPGTMNLPGTTEDKGSILNQESYFEY